MREKSFGRKKGFVLSLEAVVSLLVLGSAMALAFSPEPFSFRDVLVLQQENDLFRVWSASYPSREEAVADAKKLFGKKFDLIVEGKRWHFFGCREGLASEAVIVDSSLNEKRFLVRACYH